MLSTAPDEPSAERIARALVEERVVACASLLPKVRSIYRWEGKVEVASEVQMLLKAPRRNLELLKTRLVELHPYQVPEVLAIALAGGSERYLRWVCEATGP